MSKSKLFKEEFENPAFEDKEMKTGPPLRRRQSIYAGGEADGNEKYTSGASPDGADISIFAALPATEKDEHGCPRSRRSTRRSEILETNGRKQWSQTQKNMLNM